MNVEGTVFLLAFFVGLVIWFTKLYNVMNSATVFSPGAGWLLFIGYVLSWGVSLFMVLIDPTLPSSILLLLFNLMGLFMIGLQIAEVFFTLGKSFFTGVQAHKSRG